MSLKTSILSRNTPENPLSPMENPLKNPLIFMENAPVNPRNYVVNFRWPRCNHLGDFMYDPPLFKRTL